MFKTIQDNQEFLKKMKKAAKLHVQELQEQALAKAGIEKVDDKKDGKKKTSPRTLDQIKLHTKRKLREFKSDVLRADDIQSMILLNNALKNARNDPEYPSKYTDVKRLPERMPTVMERGSADFDAFEFNSSIA